MIYFTGSTGLNTSDTPSRVSYDPETGVSDLIEAVNVDISKSGGVRRTEGYSYLQTGNFHSLFCEDGWTCLVGKDTSIYAVNTDYSLQGVRSGLTGAPIDYCQVGQSIFYTNGTQNGMVINQVSYPWLFTDPLVSRSDRDMEQVPVAQHLEFAFGRIFFSIGSMVCWTELGLFGIYSPTINNVQFGSKVLMMKHVEDGMFISTSRNTYFCRGKDPHSWTLERVATYPAYEWGAARDYVDGQEAGVKEMEAGPCALWNSPKGVCLGTTKGKFFNITQKKIVYAEDGRAGACGLRGFHLYHSII